MRNYLIVGIFIFASTIIFVLGNINIEQRKLNSEQRALDEKTYKLQSCLQEAWSSYDETWKAWDNDNDGYLPKSTADKLENMFSDNKDRCAVMWK